MNVQLEIAQQKLERLFAPVVVNVPKKEVVRVIAAKAGTRLVSRKES